ncbi:MAG: TetR/AcrR family transcriptional regulator [Planctomycetota bacterium]|nr:TetR/AcrR family transcriptional regulator [Planctomycetota bacterium]
MGKRYPIPLTRSFGKTKEHILLESTILFAKKGYAAVSMKDIAKAIGVKPASLYNHYAGKEELWKTVMEHAIGLYLLYFEHLGDELSRAKTFSDLLEIIFSEPKKMTNIFACHAFSLIQMDQFRDGLSGTRFHDVFLRYSAEFLAERFDKCIAGNMVPAFDSKTVATVIMNNVLMAINVKVQACLGRKVPYDPSDMMANLQKLLGRLLIPEQPVPASPPRPASVGAD